LEFKRGGLTSQSERQYLIWIIEEACRAGASQQAACKVLELTPRTLQRWKKEPKLVDRRTTRKITPHNKLFPEEEKEILQVVNQKEYAYYPPAVIVPLLADQKRYLASESTVYRLLKKEEQMKHRGISKPRKLQKPQPIIATKPNQVYSWDITYLPSTVKGCFFYLYIFMDIYSRKIVGYQVYTKESSEYAADILEDICMKEKIEKKQVILHSDNGSPMKGATMLATLQKLGVIPSFSRPGVSNDNPYSEALFRTMKYTPMYPSKPFESLEKTREWVEKFVLWYNTEHLHSGIKFVTPEQRHQGIDEGILKQREDVYMEAKKKKPYRWSREIRNWKKDYEVLLNPEKGKSSTNLLQAAV
jgi:putative transposase